MIKHMQDIGHTFVEDLFWGRASAEQQREACLLLSEAAFAMTTIPEEVKHLSVQLATLALTKMEEAGAHRGAN